MKTNMNNGLSLLKERNALCLLIKLNKSGMRYIDAICLVAKKYKVSPSYISELNR